MKNIKDFFIKESFKLANKKYFIYELVNNTDSTYACNNLKDIKTFLIETWDDYNADDIINEVKQLESNEFYIDGDEKDFIIICKL